ncbi:MAG TPA: hypothetical protein VLB81_11735 [Gaiellales bacterium]|nr:hypothetical protein [Gaiellales bacterium]
MRLDGLDFVRDQYATTERLEARMAVWRPAADGRTPQDVALAALAAVRPARLLEVRPGTGAFAARCAKELGCHVIALDASADMVAATRGAVFADRAAAAAYLATLGRDALAARLPELDEPLIARGQMTVFVAGI